jgi:hypothetical protein
VRALLVVVAAKCGACGLALAGPGFGGRVGLGGTRDIPVQVLFPQGWERFELDSSGWSRVLGFDAVGGPPNGDLADEGGAQVASRWCPDWLGVTLAGVVVNLVGEVGDKLGSLCQICPPDGFGLEGLWNARQPGQRTWAGRGERYEAPVEDGRHIICGSKVASGGGCQQVAEWMHSSFGRDGEQVAPQGRPSGFSCESRNVLVGVIELCDCLGSDKLFGCDVEAVGVALDRLEKPGRWVVEFAQ